tara:strand:+ start:1499 stop:2725 length:1227 start_codon:yes stop_codon:yes gene_type:complete
MRNLINPIERFEVTDLNADYLKAWLEDDLDSIDEKTLYDLQQLIGHYASIVVPNNNVKIQYPTSLDASACADTDNDVVYVPTSTLLKGELDNTIGLMIHELHHIKLSLKGSEISEICFYMINKVLKNTYVGNDDEGWESLFEIMQSNKPISMSDLRSIYDGENKSPCPQELFYLDCIKGLSMLLNCVEDVRIDSLTQPNLKKYIDKGDALHAPQFIKSYKEGKFDNKNIETTGYKFLFHHKGFIDDDYINSTYPDINELLNSKPMQYIPVIFDTYKEEIKHFILEEYKNRNMPTESSKGGNLDEVLEEESGNSNSKYDLSKNLEIEESEFEISKEDISNKQEETESDLAMEEFKEQYVPKFYPITPTLADSIDVMGKVKIHTTTEELINHYSDDDIIEYSCVVLDDCA